MRGSLSSKVFQEQVRLIYENALPANITVAGVALVFTLIANGKSDQTALFIWIAAMILSTGLRIFLWYQHRQGAGTRTPEAWASAYTLGTLLTGVCWAGSVQFLYFSDDVLVRSTVMMIIFSLAAVAVPVLSALMPALLAYILPPTITLFTAYTLDDTPGSGLFAMSTVILTLLIIMLARYSNHSLMRSLRLQQQNDELISRLNGEIEQRTTAQLLLERHGEQLEELVKKRTKQLMDTNKDLEKEVSDRKRAEENLKHLAHHDSLTNLPNRLLLDDRLQQAIERARRTNTRLAVLFLDLDHFKNINDSLGHAIGDELLRKVSWRLRGCVREIDTVSRLGGDEFIIVMEQVNHINGVNRMAEKLMATLGEVFQIQGHSLFVGTSIGISLYPQDGNRPEELLKNADAAMYRAKGNGRNNYAFYTSELTDFALDRLMLEGSLRLALEREEFEVYYQPQISLLNHSIIGAEALVRWNHPELGLLPPARFLGVAEETGLICPIGEWVLRTACRQMTKWQREKLGLRYIAVNLAGRQIRKAGLVREIESILAETDCRADWLELEISEDYLVQQEDNSIEVLDQLADLGIHLAIDDFGIGYSSLSHLKKLPAHKLKVDRTFIRDLDRDSQDAAIVGAVIALGKGMRMEITAEGVESPQQERLLKEKGCDQAQGYRYGKPMPAAMMRQMLLRTRLSA